MFYLLAIFATISFSLLQVPRNHPLVKISALREEGRIALESLLSLCASSKISRLALFLFFILFTDQFVALIRIRLLLVDLKCVMPITFIIALFAQVRVIFSVIWSIEYVIISLQFQC